MGPTSATKPTENRSSPWPLTKMIGPAVAAACVMAVQLSAGLYMSFAIRVPMNGMSEEGQKKFLAGDKYQNASKAQLNQAEYAPMLFAALVYLAVKNASGPMVTAVSVMAPASQFIYFWGRVITGSPLPCAPLGALPRYACNGMMVYLIATTV